MAPPQEPNKLSNGPNRLKSKTKNCSGELNALNVVSLGSTK